MGKNLKVPERFLLKYKSLVHRYAEHDRNCGMNPNNMTSLYDWCTCGYSEDIKELQNIAKEIEIIDDKMP